MYRIKSNLDVNGRFWGLDFKHGEAFTERDDLARRLKSLGYAVEETVSTVANTVSVEEAPTAKEPAATMDAPAETTQEAPAQKGETPESAVETTADGKLVCPVCGKLCGSKAVLTRHMNKEHG